MKNDWPGSFFTKKTEALKLTWSVDILYSPEDWGDIAKRYKLAMLLMRLFNTARATDTPPSHWLVSWRSVRFRRSWWLKSPSPGTQKSFSASAAGNSWSTCRCHRKLLQNLLWVWMLRGKGGTLNEGNLTKPKTNYIISNHYIKLSMRFGLETHSLGFQGLELHGQHGVQPPVRVMCCQPHQESTDRHQASPCSCEDHQDSDSQWMDEVRSCGFAICLPASWGDR